MFQTIPDIQAQAITGGGQQVTNYYDRTYVLEQQNTIIGYSNAGGQFRTKAGNGWDPVYSLEWVVIEESSTLTDSSRESVAGRGGVENIYTDTFTLSDGTVLSGDPRLA